MIRWANNHKFWSQRIVTVKALAEAMHNGIVEGGAQEKALVPQFRRYKSMSLQSGSTEIKRFAERQNKGTAARYRPCL